jgi:hypothetical protein
MPLKKDRPAAGDTFYAFMAAFLSGCFTTVIMLQDYVRKILK